MPKGNAYSMRTHLTNSCCVFSRRRTREEGTATFWVASPELRPRTPSPDSDQGRKSKRSRRSDRYSDESGDDSDADRRHRRKHKKSSSSRRKKSSKHKKSSSSRRSHRRSPTPSTDSESEDDRRRSVEPVSNGKDAQAQVLEVDETQLDAVPDLWVEKQGKRWTTLLTFLPDT